MSAPTEASDTAIQSMPRDAAQNGSEKPAEVVEEGDAEERIEREHAERAA